ncbi:hypothetical protein KY285_005878 [Solanum tuberosum]|nr:hypothetical protein KY284_006038 [Solanum tuberosum]KAH0752730.1 hypothetical protein KY285_005878 [Solanum tuberosum]
MKGKKTKEQREATKELEQSIHMVKAPSVLDKDPSLTLPTKIKMSVLLGTKGQIIYLSQCS